MFFSQHLIGISSMWTYRDQLQETKLGLSLQAYSHAKHEWVHMAYFKPEQIEQAKAEYEKTMKLHAVNPHHLDFSFNNLIEIEAMLLGDEGSRMDTNRYVDMLNMITEVSHILQIRLEIA